MKKVEGMLHGYFETGTEGILPAIQNYEYISEDGKRWYYEGLEIVDPNDHLIVIKDGETVLDIVLDDYITSYEADDNTVLIDEPNFVAKWEKYPMNPANGQLHLNGCWVHWLPKNVDLKLWWDIFFANSGKYNGILRKTNNED